LDSDSDSEVEESTWSAATLNAPTRTVHFEIDIDIDINSRALSDMVAAAPVIEELTPPVRTAATEVPVQENDWRTSLDSW
jgi:hypothetical protein